MILGSLILVPVIAAAVAYVVPSAICRRLLLPLTGIAHLVLTAVAVRQTPVTLFDRWLVLDSLGSYFLSVMSILFMAVSWYAWGYFRRSHTSHGHTDERHEALFCASLLLFIATMTLVICSNHLGIFWIAMEATTLASAPLVYYYRQRSSLEAVWKYMLICSVGIGLALLGNLVLATAASGSADGSLLADELIRNGKTLDIRWLKLAVVFFLIGYGTKMGLAPMHSWLPDAHSEAPAFVSALLSGSLLNCAALGILRIYQIGIAAGIGGYCTDLFRFFGLLSLLFAAIFILGQSDFKRMLAYSSIEHMGLILLGVGIGGEAVFGALFHVFNHSFVKGMLFLVAGNVLLLFGTRSIASVGGLLRESPVNGVLWLAGFIAITGLPPFGLFFSEFLIIKAALTGGSYLLTFLICLFLGMIFAGMASAFLNMAQGDAPQLPRRRHYQAWNFFPPAMLGGLSLLGGLYLPPDLAIFLKQLATQLGG